MQVDLYGDCKMVFVAVSVVSVFVNSTFCFAFSCLFILRRPLADCLLILALQYVVFDIVKNNFCLFFCFSFLIAGRGPAYFWTSALRPCNGPVC